MKTRSMDIQNIRFLMHHLLGHIFVGFSMLIAYPFSKSNISLEKTFRLFIK